MALRCSGLIIASTVCVLAGCGGSSVKAPAASPSVASTTTGVSTATLPPPVRTRVRTPPRPAHPPFAVGERVITFVDSSRSIALAGGGSQARRLVTVVRYPAQGPPSSGELAGVPALHGAGQFPLIVFGHGFAVTPDIYGPLLRAWTRAGYVVAAPIFPLGNANAPGGPNESDLVNQPKDMSFVISGLLSASDGPGAFHQLLDPRRIAVAGQSDGGDTALAAAYDSHFLDRRVSAAVILSGAEIPGAGAVDFPAPNPPLLATQGTADTINPPSLTHAFFDVAPAPKFLLTLFGAQHLGPYTDQQQQLGIVERVSLAFLDHYLKRAPGTLGRLGASGNVPGISALQADP